MFSRSMNASASINTPTITASQPTEEKELVLVNNVLQVYPQALSPLVFHEADEFQLTEHQGSRYPNGGSSPSIGYFKEKISGALWIGKVPILPSENNNPEIQACLEMIAAGIYAYYGVSIPRLAIGRQLPVNPKDVWIDVFAAANIRRSPHLLSRWLGRFTPYGEVNSPEKIKTRWQEERTQQFTFHIDDRYIPERGLGKILAVAQWLNDNDVMGGSGGNIGYEFQTDLNGQLYARSCKIDTGEVFGDFSDMKAREISLGLRIDRNDPVGVVLSELPEVTQQEFLLTLHQIIETPDSILEHFFTREGAECLQEQNNKVIVQNTIGSIEWAKIILKARCQNLQRYYGARIQEAVSRYEHEQREQFVFLNENPSLVSTENIADDHIRFMCSQAMFAYHRAEIQQALYFYVEMDEISGLDEQIRRPLINIFEEFLTQPRERVLLLLGESGSGKSIAAQKLLYELWLQYSRNPGPQTPVPLLIELKRFTEHTVGQCIDRVLQEEHHFTQQEIDYHKQHSSFVFILDGYDEIGGQPELNLYESNRLGEWSNAKVIITCRSTDKAAKKPLLFSPSSVAMNGLSIKRLASFSPAQIQEYVNKQSSDIQIQYQTLLQQHSNLNKLVENPFILILVIQALPSLLTIESEILTQHRVYTAFMQQWFRRQEIRLTTFLGALPTATIQQTFKSFSESLALSMLSNKSLAISEDIAPDSPWQRFFVPSEGEIFYARLACPLKVQGAKYSFIHKSFFEYFAANHLFSALENPLLATRLAAWSHCFLSEERGVLKFLTERLTCSPTREQDETRLFEMVLASQRKPAFSKAASSAITLLNQGDYDFHNRVINQDLSNINIPHADLTGAFLPAMNLSGSNLSYVNFCNAMMTGASLREADLTGARFLKGRATLFSKAPVVALALHPQADIIAYGEDHEIVIVRLSDWHMERRLIGDLKRITSLVFALDGTLASGSIDGATIHLWDIQKPSGEACIQKLEGQGQKEVRILAFAPDGTLAVGSSVIHLWSNQRPAVCFSILLGCRSSVTGLAFAPNGFTLASGSADKLIRLWDIRKPPEEALIKILTYQDGLHSSLVFAPNGILATGSNIILGVFRDDRIRIWNVQNSDAGDCIKTLGTINNRPDNGIAGLAFAPNGIMLASSGDDMLIRLWDIEKSNEESCIKTFSGHTGMIGALAFASDGTLVSGSADQTIRLWDTSTLIEDVSINTINDYGKGVKSIAHAPDGTLALGYSDGSVHVKKPTEEFFILPISRGERSRTNVCLAFAPDGTLAVGAMEAIISLWNINKPAEESHIITFGEYGSYYILSLAFSRDGTLAAGKADGIIYLWDTKNTAGVTCVKTLGEEHSGWVTSLAFAPDGTLASRVDPSERRDTNTIIRFWNTTEQVCIKTITHSHVNSVAFTANERWFISCNDAEILLWDYKNWQNQPLRLPFGASCLSLHGSILSASDYKSLFALDLADFPRKLHWHRAAPCSTLRLENCDIAGALGMSSSTQQFFKKERAVGTAAAYLATTSVFNNNSNTVFDAASTSGQEEKGNQRKQCVIS